MPEEQEQYPLELAGFQKWLHMLPIDASVGVCSNATQCVLSNYLFYIYEKEFEIDDIGGGVGYYQVKGNPSTRRLLPPWAVDIAQNFDDLYLFENKGPIITKFEYLLYMPSHLVSSEKAE